jgi:uncharacterized protein (TIGR02466 family)
VKQFKLLSADIFVNKAGTTEQIQQLKEEALARKTSDPTGMFFTNENCWRSRFEYTNIDWLLKELAQLLYKAVDYYSQTDPLFPQKSKSYGKPEIDYWTNINEPHSKNSLHSHNSYHFVGCYYIQGEGTGDLVFHNSANLLQDCDPNSPFVSHIAFTPKDGDLLVWPAWVAHEVETNFSNQQRINIAFNIKFTPIGNIK